MRFHYLLFLVTLGPLIALSQSRDIINTFFKQNGAVIMAVKAMDGIILVADSRMPYKSVQTGEMLAYQDGLPKIYPLKKFAIAVSGDFSDGTTFIKKMIADFDNSKPTYRTPEECLYKFGLFTKDKYPEYFKNITRNILICAGYGPEQMIAILLNGKTYSITQDTWASNVFWEIDSLHLFSIPRDVSTRQAAVLASASLTQYIKAVHRENELGGLFSVLKIGSDNSWRWLKNDFTGNDVATECESIRDLFEKKTSLSYSSDKNKKTMQEWIRIIRQKCR
jgi:hypothetical protein